jgi:hypothetical protein
LRHRYSRAGFFIIEAQERLAGEHLVVGVDRDLADTADDRRPNLDFPRPRLD